MAKAFDTVKGRTEGRFGVLRPFQQLKLYSDNIETWNWEQIPFSLRIVPRGLSVAEGPKTVLHNRPAHLYIDLTNPLLWGPSGDSNLQTYDLEPDVVTTRPRRILLIQHESMGFSNKCMTLESLTEQGASHIDVIRMFAVVSY